MNTHVEQLPRIEINNATEKDIEVLSLLGRITYVESHGQFIEDKAELSAYCNSAFSVAKTKQDLANPSNRFYIISVDGLPVGYAKLVLKSKHKSIPSKNSCQLERIYILNEFIPLKLGQQLLSYLEDQAKVFQLDTMWLSVYIKNERAIRFYQRNTFKRVGELIFLVNETKYITAVFSKKL